MKKICIKNYNYLFLYKSLLFKVFNYYTNSNDEDLKAIVEALNIKRRKKRIEYIYDYCCNKLDKFYEGKNVCDFKNNQCRSQQIPNCKYKNGCCRACWYQSNKGCTTSNLTCKLFYCNKVIEKFEVMTTKDLKILKLFSFRQRYMLGYEFFSSRKWVIFDLWVGSILFSALRSGLNTIINVIRLKLRSKKKSNDTH